MSAVQLDVWRDSPPMRRAREAGARAARIPAARASDPQESHDAADTIAPVRSKLQERVLATYRTFGALTAKEAEAELSYDGLGFSTVRKRVSELARMGLLVATGERRDGCAVYRLAGEPAREGR